MSHIDLESVDVDQASVGLGGERGYFDRNLEVRLFSLCVLFKYPLDLRVHFQTVLSLWISVDIQRGISSGCTHHVQEKANGRCSPAVPLVKLPTLLGPHALSREQW